MSARLAPTPAQTSAARWASAALIAWFAARAVYLALVTSPAIPPDEIEHFGRSALFATTLGLPDDSPDSYAFGLMRRQPYLYPWLMGRLLAASPFAADADGLRFLRLVNVALSLLTVAAARRAMAHFTADPLERTLFLLMFTNTLMFTFLSASVNYDNLVNLLAAACFAALFAYLREGRPAALAWLGVAALAGCLTKTAFVPLAGLLALVVLWRERRAPRALAARLIGWLAAPRPGGVALGAAGALLLAANLQLYGGNLVRYGRPLPACEQVLALEACLERPNFARNWILDAYRSGRMSREEALARALAVKHPMVRRNAHYLVRQYDDWSRRGKPLVDRFHYGFEWAGRMLRGATGILGHRSLSQPAPRRIAYELLLLAAALAMVRRWRPGDGSGIPGASAFALVAYAGILMQFVNYPIYAASGAPDLALQGRYLFPVLVPLSALAAHYALAPRAPRVRLAVAAGIALLFASGDLPLYLQLRTPEWIGGP